MRGVSKILSNYFRVGADGSEPRGSVVPSEKLPPFESQTREDRMKRNRLTHASDHLSFGC